MLGKRKIVLGAYIYAVPPSTHPGRILKAKALHDKERAGPEKGGLG